MPFTRPSVVHLPGRFSAGFSPSPALWGRVSVVLSPHHRFRNIYLAHNITFARGMSNSILDANFQANSQANSKNYFLQTQAKRFASKALQNLQTDQTALASASAQQIPFVLFLWDARMPASRRTRPRRHGRGRAAGRISGRRQAANRRA